MSGRVLSEKEIQMVSRLAEDRQFDAFTVHHDMLALRKTVLK